MSASDTSAWSKLYQLYVYGSFHISICALALTWFHYKAINVHPDHIYLAFVFCSTFLTYSLHRYVGVKKVENPEQQGRFVIAARYRSHILFYCLIAAIICGWMFLCLSRPCQIGSVLTALISLAYVLPIFPRKKRLRDYGYIKIFLVGITWTAVTLVVPWWPQLPIAQLSIPAIVCILYIIAITLPFDLRDAQVDGSQGVASIAQSLGRKSTLRLALIGIGIAVVLSGLQWFLFEDTFRVYSLTMIVSLPIIAFLLYLHKETRSDSYYSLVLDGTMILFTLSYLIIR